MAVSYVVMMSGKQNGKFKQVKEIKGEDSLTFSLKLSKGTYYFKVRAYNMVSGRKVWGDYSKTIKVVVK